MALPDGDVSVIIPLYNHERYFDETMESLANQTVKPREIIVVDDGSTDSSLIIALQWARRLANVFVRHTENRGPSATLNLGIKHSSGDYISILNSDDSYDAHRLERCLQNARNTTPKKPWIMFTGVRFVTETSEVVTNPWYEEGLARFRRYGSLAPALVNANFALSTSNLFMSRAAIAKLGGFRNYRYAQDLDFLLRADALGVDVVFLEQELLTYRYHPGNTIFEDIQAVRAELSEIVASYLEGKACEANGRPGALDHHMLEVLVEHDLLDGVRARVSASHRPKREARKLWKRYRRTLLADLSLASPDTDGKPATRVLMETQSFDKGGLEKVILDMGQTLQPHGIGTEILSAAPGGYMARRALEVGIKVHDMERVGKLLGRWLKSKQFDVAISHFADSGYSSYRECGIPNITFIHNVYAFLSPEQQARLGELDEYVDAYVAVSPNAARYAVDVIGLPGGKMTVIPNGLTVHEHERLEREPVQLQRKQWGISSDDYLFVNVASYNLHKGHYLMAEAMEVVLQERADVKILCVGGEVYPPHLVQLKRHLANRGLEEHLILAGFTARVHDAYRIADAFLLPSFIEGWSIAMNEAMFYGLPMIMTETGGAPEVLKHGIGTAIPNEYGETTTLTSSLLDSLAYSPQKYRTSEVLAAAMLDFASHREYWRERGSWGRDVVTRDLDQRNVASQHAALIKSLAGKSGAQGGSSGI